MKAAIVQRPGSTPVYGDFKEPIASAGQGRIAVTAAALSPVVRARASGAHYSSSSHFPFIAGIDGVGRLDDGRRVYFLLPDAPYGSMAQTTVVSLAQCASLPDELDDVTAAAIANPGLSSWAALKERARFARGETVLINGATGTSGRLAVQIVKHLGARRIVVTGRNASVLESLRELGADDTVALVEDTDSLDRSFQKHFADGIDVVLDYLWGKSAERILIAGTKAGAEGAPIRFIQIGNSSGGNITLPASAIRSTAIELMGSGLGSIPLPRIVGSIQELLHATVEAGFELATKSVPLSDVERAWADNASIPRTIFTIG
jgi:NADPH:quinone reductase-like Zn-dependent oxidoreductase